MTDFNAVADPEAWAKSFGEFLAEHPGPNISHEKMRQSDDLYNVKERERKERQQYDDDIRDLEGQIGLASKALALRASPGWEPFLMTVTALLDIRRESLILASDERSACLLQGRCRELTTVLGLMKLAEDSVRTLNERLQYRLAERDRRFRDGKVIPVGAVE